MELLEKRFGLKNAGTNVRTEVIAGITTFATMAYILILNPKFMGMAGMDPVGVLITTALVSGLVTILMGAAANLPFALAPGIGSCVMIATGIVLPGLASWQTALGMVLISGTIFLLLSLFRLREQIVVMIPKNIKIGISAGLGVFIIRTALVNAGLITDGFKGFGDFSQPQVRLAAIGLGIALLLSFFRFQFHGKVCQVRGALLISIILTTLIGVWMGCVELPESLFTSGAISSVRNVCFKVDLLGALRLEYISLIFAFFISDFFGTLATALGLAGKIGMMDENGNFPAIGKVFLVDAIGTVIGAFTGLAVVTTYVESASGVESGGRTGLTAVVTGIMFLLCIAFAPVFLMIPDAATAPVLIMIGISMMQGLRNVDFSDQEWPPVAVMVIAMLFYGISQGIAIGLLAYCIIKLAWALFAGQRGEGALPSWPTVILTVLACCQFIL
ncbi:MAG: NCS2 family permease [Lachnospiraceae bacterium]|nr:NCS2 family permease [Lachnospiraceae bacterium]